VALLLITQKASLRRESDHSATWGIATCWGGKTNGRRAAWVGTCWAEQWFCRRKRPQKEIPRKDKCPLLEAGAAGQIRPQKNRGLAQKPSERSGRRQVEIWNGKGAIRSASAGRGGAEARESGNSKREKEEDAAILVMNSRKGERGKPYVRAIEKRLLLETPRQELFALGKKGKPERLEDLSAATDLQDACPNDKESNTRRVPACKKGICT